MNRRVEVESPHTVSQMGIEENHTIGFREILQVGGYTRKNLSGTLAGRSSVFGDILIKRHHRRPCAVSQNNDLLKLPEGWRLQEAF